MNESEIHIRVNKDEKKFILKVPYQKDIISFMKIERGFIYCPTTKERSLGLDKSGVKKLVKFLSFIETAKSKYLIKMDNVTKLVLEKLKEHHQEQLALKESETDIDLKKIKEDLEKSLDFKFNLFPYQKEGVFFIEKNRGRCIIGDEMGLGKTIQALTWSWLRGKKILIICPKSLIYNWASEIEKWIEKGTYTILQGKKIVFDKNARFSIINYDQVHKIKGAIPFDTIILDEVHYIKNSKAIRTKATLALAKKVEFTILLSGTSIKNRPIEFWTQLHLIDPSQFDNWFYYAKRYCGAYKTRFGLQVGKASNQQELNQKIAQFYLRREKSVVCQDLPDKLISEIKIDLDIPWVNKPTPLEIINDAKIRASLGKIEASIQLIETMVDMDEKVIFFSDYVEPCQRVSEYFLEKAIWMTSEDGSETRNEKIKSFQQDPDKLVFIATIKLGGVGLTLTSASKIVFNDLPWSPADLQQAEDRIYRIGQKRTCNIYRLISRSEIDEVLVKQLKYKKKNIDLVLKGAFEREENEMTPFEELHDRLTRQFSLN